MKKIIIFISIIFCICQSVIAFSYPLNNSQLGTIFKQIAYHFGLSSNAANLGDKYTACNEARNGLRLFYTIDAQDLTEAQKEFYYKGAINAREVIQSMNGVCN